MSTDMAEFIAGNHPIIKDLIKRGIISERCRKFELSCEAGSVAVLRQEIFVTAEEFQQLSVLLAEAQPQTVVVNEPTQDSTLDITPLGSDWRMKIPK